MAHKKKKRNLDEPKPFNEPKPLNFNHDEKTGPSDHLKKPFMTPAEERGDNEISQYYDEEESLSPEETKERKEEDDL